jgi:DNA processing protein
MKLASLLSPPPNPALDRRMLEMGAYEALWQRPGASFKTVHEWITASAPALASGLVTPDAAATCARDISNRLARASLDDVGIRLHGEPHYPNKLNDARHPVGALYYRGRWDLIYTRSIAVVGARQISEEGAARTRKLVRHLVEDGFTIVSGLAAGVDGIAHRTAIEMGGQTIAILGTPITGRKRTPII